MAVPQSQLVRLLEEQKKIAEELKDKGTIKEEDIRRGEYNLYRKIEEIMQLVDGQVIYDWDEYFMNVACLAALRSKDPKTPVRYCHYYIVESNVF